MSSAAEFSRQARAIADELAALTAVARATADRAAGKIEAKLQVEFAAGTTATGQAWAPLKDGSGRTPLNKTGSMESKLQVVADGLVVRGKLFAPANIHQYGSVARNIAARQIFPLPDAPLPESWEQALTEAGEEVLAEMTLEMQKAAR